MSEWISTEDSLPEPGTWVLAVTECNYLPDPQGRLVTILFFDSENEDGIFWLKDGDWEYKVTHYQPLPPPPEEE